MEKHPEEKSVEFEIDLNQRFTFPNDIVIKKFENKNIVIYTKGVLWLVFSDEELEVFNALNLGKTISQVLEKYTTDIVISVLSQIKAKTAPTTVTITSDKIPKTMHKIEIVRVGRPSFAFAENTAFAMAKPVTNKQAMPPPMYAP